MAASKYLTETGVRRLWQAIEAKFIDVDELQAALVEVAPGTAMEALTNAEIDEITGYVEPVTPSENPEEP